MSGREDIERIMQNEGQVKGTVFLSDARYVERHFGKAGLEKAQEKLRAWGHPIDYDKVKAMGWYPAGLRVLSLLAISEALSLNDEQVFAMGLEGPKHSFLIKLLLKLFVSVQKIFENAPMVWRRHWTTGSIELVEIDEAAGRIVVRLKDIKLHPLFCKYEEGYFTGIARLSQPNASARETKCMFRGDHYHEYVFHWKG